MKKDPLSIQGIFLIIFLVLQYILGMFTNMFVSFPSNGSDRQMWEFAWRQLPLVAHIILGFLLLIGSIVLVIRSIQRKNKSWIIASSCGLGSILLAVVAGALFIPSQTDMYSFVMAMSFIVALLSYGTGIYLSK